MYLCAVKLRAKYHRDPSNGDVYMFMSKDQTKVKMIHYENHAYYVHEKCLSKVILWKR
ncbi:IS66 family insertion sequence element accessory protein TnpB [Prevotella sp. P5-92]|uniref:IS66 family insertion sequence element accessory protein TnpB n=1 Tax=Prevotella sp. P5-92 TaxID=2024222 RepID=UPI00117DE165